MAAGEFIVATNAGNRFGKTTAMVVWSIIQHTPDELLPDRLKVFKRAKSKVVQGRYTVPSEEFLEENVLPVYKRWTPPSILRKAAWKDAYRKAPGNSITFEDGGKVAFPTYKQDPSMLAGWSGDYVLWDEPPPESHWREGGPIRVLDRGGCHRFGMTPVNMQGGGIGWIKRRIFDRAKPSHPDFSPNIRHVQASIWDNPDYSAEEVEMILSEYPEDERQAREHGAFIHFGGMIYPGGFESPKILRDPPTPDEVNRMEIVVGIDPGLKNAAFVWGAFDNDNRLLIFDEAIVKEGTPLDYVKAIRQVNSKWRLKEQPLYVIDPSARNRSLINAESVEGELQRQGIYPIHGQNQVQAGVQQIRRRMAERGFFVSKLCTHLRAEAEEYRMEDRPDGEFKVVKELDHALDATRYLAMTRPWYPGPDEVALRQQYSQNHAPSWDWAMADRTIPEFA
jgi:hypothetical protein